MRIAFDESFNWLAVLKDLAAGATFDGLDYQLLRARAGEWPTCACGALCRDLPKDELERPKDSLLRNLGVSFFEHVRTRNWTRALSTFHRIEARTQELLDEQQQEREKGKKPNEK